MSLPTPLKIIPITAGTESAAFEIEGELGNVIVGTVNSGTPTLTLQVSETTTGWIDTTITATGSTSAKSLITADTLAAIAGLCGHGARFRWSSSASVTVNLYHYSRQT